MGKVKTFLDILYRDMLKNVLMYILDAWEYVEKKEYIYLKDIRLVQKKMKPHYSYEFAKSLSQFLLWILFYQSVILVILTPERWYIPPLPSKL